MGILNFEKGFTLVELIVTLTFASILALYAIPNFIQFVDRTRYRLEIHHLIQSVELARSEAIKRGQYVTLCPSNNKVDCGDNWGEGYLVFVDTNHNGLRESTEILLSSHQPSLTGQNVTFKHFGRHQETLALTLSPLGQTQNNGSFRFMPNDSNQFGGVKLVINSAGIIREERDTPAGDS